MLDAEKLEWAVKPTNEGIIFNKDGEKNIEMNSCKQCGSCKKQIDDEIFCGYHGAWFYDHSLCDMFIEENH